MEACAADAAQQETAVCKLITAYCAWEMTAEEGPCHPIPSMGTGIMDEADNKLSDHAWEDDERSGQNHTLTVAI